MPQQEHLGSTSSSRESAPDRARPRWRGVLAWLVQFALSLGLYFCFTTKVDLLEALLGAVAAALAATGSHVVLCERVAPVAGFGRWIVETWRLPKYAVAETGAVLLVLARHLFTSRKAGSLLIEVPFACGGGDEEDAAVRRALAAASTTMTPSSVVLGFDERRGRMFVHQLEPGASSEMTRRLGARA